MAGDWIVYTKDLPTKPEVLRLVRLTGLSRPEVVYLLLGFWSWVDDHSADGFLPGLTFDDLSAIVPPDVRILSGDVPGFVRALSEVGWLVERDGGVAVPHFDRWNTRSAKQRAVDRRRKRQDRRQPAAVPDRVRTVSAPRPQCVRDERDKSRTVQSTDTGQYEEGIPHTPSCPETAPAVTGPPAPPLLTFPTDGPVKEWRLTAADLAELAAAFPSLDALAECRRALAWVLADPARRKTARGMKRFLVGWLGRAQDRGAGRAPQHPAARPGLDERIARAKERLCPRPGTNGSADTPPSSA